MITVKVAKSSQALLKDLRSMRLCNKATRRACSSRVVSNRINLENHYHSTVWGERQQLDMYLQTVDWLQGANNAEALFIMGMGNICSGRPGGAALLARAEEEGDLHACYVLAVVKYYMHDATMDVFNHIRCVYGEYTSCV
jgi:hypothetical protein